METGDSGVGRTIAKVMIVDDDQDIRDTLRMALEDEGYVVEEASDGIRALAQLRTAHEPMVVLLDLMMPNMGGAGVLDAVAKDQHLAKRFAYVLVTADSSTQPVAFVRQMHELGVPLIGKPFDLDHLFRVIEESGRRLRSTPGGTNHWPTSASAS